MRCIVLIFFFVILSWPAFPEERSCKYRGQYSEALSPLFEKERITMRRPPLIWQPWLYSSSFELQKDCGPPSVSVYRPYMKPSAQKRTFRYFLYETLKEKKPRFFYRALFYRRNFIHPQSILWLQYEKENFEETVKRADSSKLEKVLLSQTYGGFRQEDLEGDSEKTRDVICGLLRSSRPLRKSRDVWFLPLFERRILSLPEVLNDLYSEDSYVFSRFYYRAFCLREPAQICVDSSDLLREGPLCQKKGVFTISFDGKAFSSKLNQKLLEKVAEPARNLIRWVVGYREEEGEKLVADDEFLYSKLKRGQAVSSEDFEYYLLDLDYLWLFERAQYAVREMGLSKRDEAFWLLSEYKHLYSKSFILPFSHGQFFYRRSASHLMSAVRRVKEASCVGRAVHTFLLTSIFFPSKFVYRYYLPADHAVVYFRPSESEVFVVDNAKVVSKDRALKVAFAAAKRVSDRLMEKESQKLLTKFELSSKDLTVLSLMNSLYDNWYRKMKSCVDPRFCP